MKAQLIFFISTLLLNACRESNRNIPQTIIENEKFTKKTTYLDWNKGKKIKLIEGNFFNEKIYSRVHLEFIMDSIVRVRIYKLNHGNWLPCFADSIPINYYLCDSLLDLNGDGNLELVLQKNSGMGNVTDYYCSIYTMINHKIIKLLKTESMLNISFLPKDKSFTTLEKSENLKIGRKYSWNHDLSFKLLHEQIIKRDSNGGYIKKYYLFENDNRVFFKQIKSDLIDDEYWGFQKWCQ